MERGSSAWAVRRRGHSSGPHAMASTKRRCVRRTVCALNQARVPQSDHPEAPALAGLASASVQGLVALGPSAGARVPRYGDPPEEVEPTTLGPSHAQADGFDLHAGIVVQAGERERLERLCRYALRPPIAQARLRLDPDGHVVMTLRHRWADGTTHLRFDPVALLARLAVLIPRPRINLVLYYGLLAPRAPWRGEVVASAVSEGSDGPAGRTAGAPGDDATASPSPRRPSACLWADLMRRTFGA
jgi:hypothetical protein